jgi:hypothetical protein
VGPDLVYVSPGVQVIADYDEPIFYTDGFYWRETNGIWYRSSYHTHGWVTYHAPRTVLSIGNRHSYRRYRPAGYVRRDHRNDHRRDWDRRDHDRRPDIRDNRDRRPDVRDHRDGRPDRNDHRGNHGNDRPNHTNDRPDRHRMPDVRDHRHDPQPTTRQQHRDNDGGNHRRDRKNTRQNNNGGGRRGR